MISEGRAADLDEVLALLASVDLRSEGVAQQTNSFLIARENGRLVATAGLEDHGLAGILRSVAVASGYRCRGIAATLVRAIIGRSRAKGHEALYLLTRSAEPFFARFGFVRVEREDVRPAARVSRQFAECACEQSVVMALEHNRSGEVAMNEHAIREAVRTRYARAATAGVSCCGEAGGGGEAPSECCASPDRAASLDCGPSLGCGAPIEAAALQPGESVVDLGSGAGLDVFLAAERVGPGGRVVGVDMTPEMIAKARANADRLGAANVEFRLGEIEHLPLPDACADVIVSNCVINLLPDKRPAFAEAFRVLRSGGRLVVSDIVSAGPLPEELKTPELWSACVGGALPEADYLGLIANTGFTSVEVLAKRGWEVAGLFSVTVRAVKPGRE